MAGGKRNQGIEIATQSAQQKRQCIFKNGSRDRQNGFNQKGFTLLTKR
jgi:hypothetical protein